MLPVQEEGPTWGAGNVSDGSSVKSLTFGGAFSPEPWEQSYEEYNFKSFPSCVAIPFSYSQLLSKDLPVVSLGGAGVMSKGTKSHKEVCITPHWPCDWCPCAGSSLLCRRQLCSRVSGGHQPASSIQERGGSWLS